MPKGQLFMKSSATEDWVDTYERYGLSLESGAIASLIAPAPHKKPTSNSNAVSDGISCLAASIGKTDSKSLSIDLHICASSEKEYLSKYSLFCSEMLSPGYFMLKTSFLPTVVYHLLYQDCQPFQQ